MLVRSDKFRASKIMAERVQKTENIEILMNTETDEVLGDGQVVTGVRAKNRTTGALTEIAATGFFVAIGHKPNTDIFADFITLDETDTLLMFQVVQKLMFQVYLWLVMRQTMCTVRQLLRQEQDVWQH